MRKLTTGEMVTGGVALLVGGALLVSAKSGEAAAVPGAPQQGQIAGTDAPAVQDSTPAWTPPSRTLQSRPIGNISAMSASQKRDLVSVMQAQLNLLGYNGLDGAPLVVDGVDGRNTAHAATEFGSTEHARVDAYAARGDNTAHQYLNAIDDKYRENTGADRAPDYVAAASAGIMSPAKHRRTTWR